MTTSQRLKMSVISALDKNRPDESITVLDAKSRTEFPLPVLAVDVTAIEPHSESLQNVERITLQAVLRVHAGDSDDSDIDGWIDQIETLLTDVSLMKALATETVKAYSWIYGGSSQEWDESMLEVTFSVECLCARFDVQPQHDESVI
jgi:hypothetical protein